MTYKHYPQPDHNSTTVKGHSSITVTDNVSKYTNIDYSRYDNILWCLPIKASFSLMQLHRSQNLKDNGFYYLSKDLQNNSDNYYFIYIISTRLDNIISQCNFPCICGIINECM